MWNHPIIHLLNKFKGNVANLYRCKSTNRLFL